MVRSKSTTHPPFGGTRSGDCHQIPGNGCFLLPVEYLGHVITRHPYNAAVAAELSGYLKAAGMTQKQLALATGISEGVIQRYLAGTRIILVPQIYDFGVILNFEPKELMERASARYAR